MKHAMSYNPSMHSKPRSKPDSESFNIAESSHNIMPPSASIESVQASSALQGNTPPEAAESVTDNASDARHQREPVANLKLQTTVEHGGRSGPDPVRYGDWEKNGRCIDF